MQMPGSLSSRLRDAVLPVHRRIENLPFFAALALRTLSVERYVDQLRAVAIVTAATERGAAGTKDALVAAAAEEVSPRLDLLLEDLAHFDRRGPLPDDPLPVEEALSLAREIVRTAAESPAQLLGPLYVLQGTALGNLVHLEDARAAAGGPGGVSWYAGLGAETVPRFRKFCERIDEIASGAGFEEETRAAVIAAAVSAAEGLERVHAALDPESQPPRRLLATTLNVEAGSHDVPEDPALVSAALRAGTRCLEEFPYFLERWGERGRRYTKSDVAWLAALSALDGVEARRQISWLARVLARRGMPTLLLERQLVLLEEELASSAPSSRWSFLGETARALSTWRNSALPVRVCKPLADAFVASAGSGTEEERRRAARILLAAVADEAAGLPGTLRAVLAWYEQDRFPADWNEAVEVLVRDAFDEALKLAPGEGGLA